VEPFDVDGRDRALVALTARLSDRQLAVVAVAYELVVATLGRLTDYGKRWGRPREPRT
jgi:hypothetical protein